MAFNRDMHSKSYTYIWMMKIINIFLKEEYKHSKNNYNTRYFNFNMFYKV